MHCRTAFFLALLTASSFASGGPVYRCGSTYGEKPCADGKAVDVADARSSEQARAAVQKTNVDARLADQMERARLAQEARAPKAVIPPEHKPAETRRVMLVKKGAKNGRSQEYVVEAEPRSTDASTGKSRHGKTSK